MSQGLVQAGGYIALAIIVFTETGLMIGFFLPGDSLLVTAGLFAAKGDLNIVCLNVLLIVLRDHRRRHRLLHRQEARAGAVPQGRLAALQEEASHRHA